MKKKILAALLTSCMLLSVGSVSYAEEQPAETAAETSEETKEENKEESQEAAAEEQTAEEKKEDSSYQYERIVTVEDPAEYVKLADYKGLKLVRTVEIVEEDAIDSAIQEALAEKKESVTDEIRLGDTVIVDYVGTRNGEEFEGGTADGFWMDISEENGTDGMVGMKRGETKELTMLPTEESVAQDGDGQTVYQVTIRGVYRVPELTDEWVAANTESKTVKEYREAMRGTLQEQAKLNADLLMQDQAWQQVAADSKVGEYPEADMEAAKKSMQEVMETYAAQAGLELTEMLEQQGYTEETYQNVIEEYAQAKVTQDLLVQAILDVEKIDMKDEVTKTCQANLEKMYNMTLAEMVETFGKNSIDESLALMRVEQFIADNAEITDNAAQGDTVGVAAN